MTSASLTTEMTALNTAISAFNASRTARTAASALTKKYLSEARGVLVSHWGESYSGMWGGAVGGRGLF